MVVVPEENRGESAADIIKTKQRVGTIPLKSY
jgi:hypothetical protein